MKKLSLLIGVLALSLGTSMAYINEDKTSDVDTLRAQGYSDSMLEIVDFTNATNQGINSKYQRRFSKKNKNFLGKAYTYVKDYFDPIQDDGDFGHHQIEYTNTWNGDETKYSTRLKDRQVDNL